jgi:hypothetical protein
VKKIYGPVNVMFYSVQVLFVHKINYITAPIITDHKNMSSHNLTLKIYTIHSAS